ncbi:SAM-dependent methyltransferase [Falsiroseomonas ponticola]|uniref:SAM-dependent methyltransferase n=1 Tax=Falsiroseomonas ponticola TaxID=2786951 RepID=UPI0019312468|nr:methyltransferase domain-containing protein [Roseomonas ponticola]
MSHIASIPPAAARQARRVARYYRWLDRLSWFDERRAEAGHGALPVHRALADPAGGPPSTDVIHRLMLEGLALPPGPRVLDAGCGYGASMLHLAPALGGEWLGLTLSPVQAARGMAVVAERGLAGRVRIEVASYDAPPPGDPPGRFDLIYGIESLIHAADPFATIRTLAARLNPGGHLVVVDDMPAEAMPAEAARRLARFRRFWRCPVAPTRQGWIDALRAAGLAVVAERDLNPLLQLRGPAAVAPRLRQLERRAMIPRLLGFGLRAEAEIGGLLLESLQAEGHVHYRILAARAPL